ncbi:DUF6471 domain-containing protein [Maribacter algicola]|uniref:DUF6471 domain-containing protein n=1 Tax=Meishania litoralis TaxID=3434685 RepID=A0ACC7LMS0_9FLAO
MFDNVDWNEQSKRLLKSELVKRGISHEELAFLLNELGARETKASIDSKISRGTFSAAFLLQCLNALECEVFDPIIKEQNILKESRAKYNLSKGLEKTRK